MKKWISITVLSLVGLIALVLLLGAMTPVQHVASVSAWFDQPPAGGLGRRCSE